MKRWTNGPRKLGVLAVAAALSLTACGGSSSTSGSSDTKDGGSATVDLIAAPATLDPGLAYTSQSQGADWLVYTGLLTYKRANGSDGGKLIPGLATALPKVSDDGMTYSLTLRKGLKYSDGTEVKPEDFSYAIKRAIKLNWGGVSFFTGLIVGASDYQAGTATEISGITADDSTNEITIQLTTAYSAFGNVLAFTAAGLVPTGTAMTNLAEKPPVGVGPYVIQSVKPSRSYVLVKSSNFKDFKIPDIPVGNLDKITIQTQANPITAAQDVLQNKVDAFDPSNPVPASMLANIKQTASDRFETVPTAWTFYFWMNTRIAPFNNKAAREAVAAAVDRSALQKLSNGFLAQGCQFIPPTIPGHDDDEKCPKPDLAKAKKLVADAGLTGAPVTVWGPNTSPRSAYVDYYTSVLNEIGFSATSKLTAGAVYGSTIGAEATQAQSGYGDWSLDFPHPTSFFTPLSAGSINPEHNINYSYVDDPTIEAGLKKLNLVPASELDTVADQWSALDQVVTDQAYEVTFGYGQLPKFLSDRIDFSSAVFHPIYFDDYSSWKLKK